MLPWSVNEAAALAGGRVRGDGTAMVRGVSIDTRTLKKGDLYVAIRGRRFDGHAFVREAFRHGAAGVVVDRGTPGRGPRIIVKDTGRALGDLGRAQRLQWDGPVVAVTGSAGKTTVKDLTAHLLGGEPSVLKSRGNLNNRYGLPLTLLRLEPGHRVAVVELGINHPGEMEPLARIAVPDVAVVTNVGMAHIGNFGGRRKLAAEKFRIMRGLREKGTIVLNIDDRKWMGRPGRDRKTVTFGMGRADVQAVGVSAAGGSVRFNLKTGGIQTPTCVAMPGTHSVKNALAAFAAATALGEDVKPLADRMRSFRPEAPMRMQRVDRSGILFVNDAYNASPTSVPAALEAFREITVAGRKCIVLGDMLELGFFSNRAHEEALRRALDEEVELWVFVGNRMGRAFRSAVPRNWVEGVAERRAFHFPSAPDAIPLLRGHLRTGDAVLLKASRGVRLERIQEAF